MFSMEEGLPRGDIRYRLHDVFHVSRILLYLEIECFTISHSGLHFYSLSILVSRRKF